MTRRAHALVETYDIGELALACLQYEPSLEPLLRASAPLTEYAWRFTYPGEPFEPPRQEVESALELARLVVGEVRTAAGEMAM